MRPIGPKDAPLLENLFIAGTVLSGGDYLRELSMDGIDLATAFRIAGNIA
jgi:anaerobic glycerol-3-phosphate dehydrogenase